MENNNKTVDRRVRKTDAAIRSCLIDLLKQKPIQDITVREISDLADINRGTFYLHYKDVFDLVARIEDELADELSFIIDSRSPEELKDNPFPIFLDVFTFLSENAQWCSVFLSKNGDSYFVERIKEIIRNSSIQHWRQIYPGCSEKTYDYFYSFIISGCLGILKDWLEGDQHETPQEIAALASSMVVQGINILK